jgi:hypothetical protein
MSVVQRYASRSAQQGAALLVLLSIILLTIGYTVISGLNKNRLVAEREAITAKALAQAKEALIGYAMMYPETHLHMVPGHFLCPDIGTSSPEGTAGSSCGATGASVIGHLPWRTLGLSTLKDADGNCLWYAVSGNYKNNPKANLLNWDTVGQFRIVAEDGTTVIAGNTPADQAVAVIFAPGPPIGGQNRNNMGGTCGKDYNAAHFLDVLGSINNASVSPTAEGVTTFAARGPADSFNDRLLWITRDDLFKRGIEKRSDFSASLFDPNYKASASPALAQRIAECISNFRTYQGTEHKSLPWASPLILAAATPNTFQNDRFADIRGKYVGRVPFSISQSRQDIGGGNFNKPWLQSDCDLDTFYGCKLLLSNKPPPPEPPPEPQDRCPSGWNKVAGSDSGENYGQDGWWDKWKDQFFYAVAPNFKPGSTIADNPGCDDTIPSRKCLYVFDDNGKKNGPFAAIIIFAGAALDGQLRDTLAQKNDPQNYLENGNAEILNNNNTSSLGFGQFRRTVDDPKKNDQFVCISPALPLNLSCTTP